MGHTRCSGGHASNQASAVDRTDAGPARADISKKAHSAKAQFGGKPMGESHPSRATAPACQLLTEQPGKDLQTMGRSGRRAPQAGNTGAGTPPPSHTGHRPSPYPLAAAGG